MASKRKGMNWFLGADLWALNWELKISDTLHEAIMSSHHSLGTCTAEAPEMDGATSPNHMEEAPLCLLPY